MFRFILTVLFFASGSSAILRAPRDSSDEPKLFVETYKFLEAGTVVNDGFHKAAKSLAHADVIALQNTGKSKGDSDETVASLLKFFPSGWTGVSHCNGDTAIITRHTILGVYEHVSKGMNVRIELDSGREISFWAMHLSQLPYGPDKAIEGQVGIATDEIYAGESNRINEIVELLQHPHFVDQIKNSDNIPVIVAGCFNTPSHLDWTYTNRGSNRFFVIEWPVTKLLSEAAGMTDAYREKHPNPDRDPGFTWPLGDGNVQYVGGSRLYYVLRMYSRIDYIFYRGSLKPVDAYSPGARFEFTPRKHENKPSFYIPTEYFQEGFTYGKQGVTSPFVDPRKPYVTLPPIKLIDKCPLKIIS